MRAGLFVCSLTADPWVQACEGHSRIEELSLDEQVHSCPASLARWFQSQESEWKSQSWDSPGLISMRFSFQEPEESLLFFLNDGSWPLFHLDLRALRIEL